MKRNCRPATSTCASSTRRSTTRTRWPSPAAARSCADGRSCPASTWPAWSRRSRDARWQAGRPRRRHRLGPRRSSTGAGSRSARACRPTGCCACRTPTTTRQAMAIGTAGFTAALCVMALRRHGLAAGRRRGARDRRGRRRRLDGGRAARRARLSRRRRRPAAPQEADYLRGARRRGDRRSRRAHAAGQAAAEGALGRRRRRRGQPHARQRLRADALERRGGRLRPGAGRRLSGHGDAVHPARRARCTASTACSTRTTQRREAWDLLARTCRCGQARTHDASRSA